MSKAKNIVNRSSDSLGEFGGLFAFLNTPIKGKKMNLNVQTNTNHNIDLQWHYKSHDCFGVVSTFVDYILIVDNQEIKLDHDFYNVRLEDGSYLFYYLEDDSCRVRIHEMGGVK